MSRILLAATLAFALALASVRPAYAQPVSAGSFDQLRMLTRLGDTVTITDASGATTTGTLVSLSPSTLSVLVGQTRHDLAEQDVRRVIGRTHANLARGAKTGFGIGAGLGLLAGLAVAGDCHGGCAAWIPAAAFTYAGFGAGIGVGVAAMITRHPLLYDSGGPPTGPAKAGRDDDYGGYGGRSPGIAMTLRF